MRYEGSVFRPPGERFSYLLQVTIGCSHNACTFCGMYKDKHYRVRAMAEILEDISMAKERYGALTRVFLCDGDALALPTRQLLTILDALYDAFPTLEKVGIYAGPRSILSKSPEELSRLRQAGLTRAYLGVETGSDALLKATCKGVNAEQMLEAGVRVREAGIDLWVMLLLGLAGGGEAGQTHARDSATLLNRMRPRHLSLLSLMVVEGTPLWQDWQSGRFRSATPRETLGEIRTILSELTVEPLHFTCDHASNYLPMKGSLPEDRPQFLAALDAALNGNHTLRPDRFRGL